MVDATTYELCEHGGQRARQLFVLGGFVALATVGLGTLLLATGMVSMSDPDLPALFVGMTLGALGSGAVLYKATRSRMPSRRVSIDASTRSVRVTLRDRAEWRTIGAHDLNDCRLTVHPVRLDLERAGHTVCWTGHAAILHTPSSDFVMACQRRIESVEQYCTSLPVWLRNRRSLGGELVSARGVSAI